MFESDEGNEAVHRLRLPTARPICLLAASTASCSGSGSLAIQKNLDQTKPADGVALGDEFGGGGIDTAAAEVVDIQALDD